jgi:organic hydroperoxide reductase OsmC/OhrA
MNTQTKILHYKTVLKHDKGFCTITAPGITQKKITIVTNKEFKDGKEDEWTSGHVFLASLCSCLVTDFIAVARNSKFDYMD